MKAERQHISQKALFPLPGLLPTCQCLITVQEMFFIAVHFSGLPSSQIIFYFSTGKIRAVSKIQVLRHSSTARPGHGECSHKCNVTVLRFTE